MIELNIVVLVCFSEFVVFALVVISMPRAILAANRYKLVTATFSALMLNWYDYTTLTLNSLIRP